MSVSPQMITELSPKENFKKSILAISSIRIITFLYFNSFWRSYITEFRYLSVCSFEIWYVKYFVPNIFETPIYFLELSVNAVLSLIKKDGVKVTFEYLK